MIRVIHKIFGIGILAAALLSGNAQAESITVATGSGFVPFHFKEGNKMVGFDIDLWNAIANDMGITYTLQPMDFNGIIPALQTGQVDAAIAAMGITDKRSQVVDFSNSYYASDFLFMVRSNSTLKGGADMNGKVIAVKTGTTGAEYAKKHFPRSELRLFPNGENAYLEVMSGRADASLQDAPNVLYFIKMNGEGKVKGVGGPFETEQLGIAFPKGSTLRERVNQSLTHIKTNGKYAELYRKWFNSAPPEQQ